MKVLAGDIGGTKTSLAIFEVNGTKLEFLAKEKYPSGDYGSLDEIVQNFVKAQEHTPEWGSFGIAGPVRNGKAQTTNLPWLIDAKKLADEVGFKKVWLMNDLEANAWGISALEEKDFCVLNEGKTESDGNASIISAGTGLGEAGLYWNGKQLRPFASEGGHSDFSPKSDLEISLLQYLKKIDSTGSSDPHVSWEKVLSGTGLENVYNFLCDNREKETPSWLAEDMKTMDHAAAISKAANDTRPSLCSDALDMFVNLYGAEAGNHALKTMSTAGVYIGGGIAPKNIDRFMNDNFLNGFFAKGRMEQMMRDMPVKVILNQRTALYGPAVFAGLEIKNS